MANKLEFELKINVNMKVEEVRAILEKTFKMPVSEEDAQIVLIRLLKWNQREDVKFICPSCKETFKYPWGTCPNCNDNKIVPVCEKCKGSGVDPENTELYCDDCGGDGRLPMRPYAAVKQMASIYKSWQKGEFSGE